MCGMLSRSFCLPSGTYTAIPLVVMKFLSCCISLLFARMTFSVLLDDMRTHTDQECLLAVNHENFMIKELTPEVLGLAMNRGLWKCAKDLARIANEAQVDLRSVFDLESRIISKEIGLLKSAIESGRPMNTINPAFQWAQSPTDVFLNVKFAHKLDAPATLNVEAQNVTLAAQSLALRASDGRKLFVLDIDFLKEIIPEDSSWSMASVGRMTITLKKKLGPSKWVRLTRNRKKPNNLHYWFEIHEKYSADLEKIKDDDDDDGDGDETEKKTNTTNPNATTPSVTPKKKSKKEKRAEKAKGVSVEEEKEKAQEAQWLKTQLAEVDDRVKEKKKEVEEEFRLKKKVIEDAAEKEKEELKSQHAEKVRLIEEKYKASNPSNLKEEL